MKLVYAFSASIGIPRVPIVELNQERSLLNFFRLGNKSLNILWTVDFDDKVDLIPTLNFVLDSCEEWAKSNFKECTVL